MTHLLDPFIHLFVIVYLDDIICIYSKSAEEHLDHLRKVLTTLQKNKLSIKMEKNVFGLNEKPSILVSSLEVAMFEHPNQKSQQ